MIKRLVRSTMSRVRSSDWKQQYNEMRRISTVEQLTIFQEKYLEKLLLHAYCNVPYYTRIFEEIGIIRDNRADLSRFSEIPILTKQTMRAYEEELVSRDYTERKWYYNASGGSTGEPIKFIQDDTYDKWGGAAFHYWYKELLGIDEQGAKKVILWGSESDIFQSGIGLRTKINRWFGNVVFLNSFRMTEEDMKQYVDIINSYRPHIIQGYADSLYDLCQYAEKNHFKIHTPTVIVSSAEMLTDKARTRMESLFGTKLYDFYGSRETSNLAGECGEGLMHIMALHNHIEVLGQNGQPVTEGEEGNIVVTNLHNYSMPFIRYDIGDTAVLGPRRCQCGSILPTLKSVTGRTTDHFVKDDGTVVSGHAISLMFSQRDWVGAFQIIQEDYKIIRLLVVPQGMVTESEKTKMEHKIRVLMGEDCQLLWDFVDEIPKTPQGKHLYIISLVAT